MIKLEDFQIFVLSPHKMACHVDERAAVRLRGVDFTTQRRPEVMDLDSL